MFFQQTTPDTSGYMIAGYVIAFLIMGLYIASIYVRARSLRQDMSMLEEMDEVTPTTKQQRGAVKPADVKTSKTVTK